MKTRAWFTLGLAALLLTAACSNNDILGGSDNGDADLSDLTKPVVLEILGSDTFNVAFNASQQLTVRARYNDGLPAANREVTFTISGAAMGSALISSAVYTDNEGIAVAEILSAQDRSSFLIIVSSGNSNQVQFTINVVGDYLGKLRVRYTYSGVVALNTLTTRIHPLEYDCANGINWAALPPWEQMKVAANSGTALIFENLPEGQIYTVTVSALGPAGNEVARGCAKTDEIGGNNIRDVFIPMVLMPVDLRGTYEIGSRLNLPDMLPDDGGTEFTVTDVFLEVVSFFDDPGQYLYNWLVVAASQLGSYGQPLLDGLAGAGLSYYCNENPTASWDIYHCECHGHLADCDGSPYPASWTAPGAGQLLDFLIIDFAPGWLTDTLLIGESISEMAQNLAIGGTLNVNSATAGTGNTIALAGTENWTDYMFTWKYGNCTFGGSDPCCGRQVFGAGEQGLTVASASFTGTATPNPASGQILYNVQLDDHVLSLQYGTIISYLLQHIAFPAITGYPAPVDFGDMIIYLIPVEKIACWLNDQISSATTNDYDVCMGNDTPGDPNDGCKVVLTTNGWEAQDCPGLAATFVSLAAFAGDQVNGMLSDLEFGGTDTYKFTIGTNPDPSVTNTIEDVDHDLKTDELHLTLTGTVHYGDNISDSNSMSGVMNGDQQRVPCPDPEGGSGCDDGKTCQIRPGLVNECDARMVCLVNKGSRTGGTACNNDDLCQSGWCMPSPRVCYQACLDDAHCPGGFTCAQGGFEFDFGGGFSADVNGCTNQ